MKKILGLCLSLVVVLAGCSYDDGELWNKVNDLDGRLTKVEDQLSKMNGNITSLQTVINAIQNNVYVTNVTQTANGYTITFSDNKTVTLTNGQDGQTPFIGTNGNWWIGNTDTGVKAAGETPHIGDNGNWWFGNTDTGVKAMGQDGKTPYIGTNGNWWIDNTDTGVPAKGQDGLTPFIGTNGNWWIGIVDTGVPAGGQNGGSGSAVPIIGVDIYNGVYYWTQTINGNTTWLLDKDGNKLPVSGYAPVFKIDVYGHIVYSIDGGITWVNIYDEYGNPVTSSSGCDCTKFFQNVYISGDYLYLVLVDGTVVKIRINGDDGGNRGGIPEDPNTPSPDVPDPNTNIPYPNVLPSVDDWGNYVVTMNLTGIQDPNSGEWLDLYGTGLTTQNVWVDVDGSPKGILVINLEDNVTRVKNDIVFTVDNSGSMGEEADAIARDIISWAQMLTNNNLDVKFGVVGYDVYGRISGALNITSTEELNSYLSRTSGTGRTVGFSGSYASTLQSKSTPYNVCNDECGAVAIKYANDNYNFRAGSNRIYVNFTDEPNQPNNKPEYSVEWFKSQTNWSTSNGTVHTVYSDSPNFTETLNYREKPWKISEYTGGTTMFVNSNASDLNLNTLTVSDALTHAYTIKFIIPASLLDGQPHTIRIVIVANNGTVRGLLEVTAIFGTL